MALFLPTPHFVSSLPSFPSIPSPSLSPSRSRLRSQKLHGHSARTSSSPRMVFNDYVAGRFPKVSGGSNRMVDSCLVVPPPAGRNPTAIVKFLGGAFIGAVPEGTYGYLMEWLAKEGFLVVSVPYNVTFDHERVAREVYERFHSCMDSLFSSGVPDAGISTSYLASLPLHSVGHSNGALLQMLVGSYFAEKIPEANAIIAFNNRPAAEAVPYFEQFGPMVSQVMPIVEASPVYSMARNASGDAWKSVLVKAGTLIQDYDQGAIASLTKFVDQLPSVMNQVTQGTSEFKPTPPENRECFKKS